MKEIVYILNKQDISKVRKMTVIFMESLNMPPTTNNSEIIMNYWVSYRFLTPYQASIACGIGADKLIIDRTVITCDVWKKAKLNMAPVAKEIIYI